MRCENIDRMAPLFAGPPVLCGHRGMGAGTVLGHAENTLGSFLAAGALGLPWVEVDVRITADDVLVCRHDPVVEDGRFVIDLAAEETDALGLLRFADLLDGLPPGLGLDVEVKSSLEDALRPRERTTGALAGARWPPREASRPVLVTSFDAAALTIAREHADVPTGLLTWMRFPLRKAIPAAVHLGRRRRAAALLLVRRRAGARPDRAHARPSTSPSRTRRGSRWPPGRRRPRRRSRWSRRGSTASSSTTPTRAPGRRAGAS